MEVSYARLVETFGEPNACAGELDADKVSAQWLLATSEGPTWVLQLAAGNGLSTCRDHYAVAHRRQPDRSGLLRRGSTQRFRARPLVGPAAETGH